MKYEYEYDEHGNMTLDKQCRWDKNNDVWVLVQKYEYKHDSNGNRTLWAYSADIVNHYFKYEYAYDLQHIDIYYFKKPKNKRPSENPVLKQGEDSRGEGPVHFCLSDDHREERVKMHRGEPGRSFTRI